MAIILDGKKIRDNTREQLKVAFGKLPFKSKLVIIKVGEDAVQDVYVRQKKIFGDSIGVEVTVIGIPANSNEKEIIGVIEKENNDKNTHGIIVQLPLPKELDKLAIIEAINPEKDVDSLTSLNTKKLYLGFPKFIPATTKGILTLLDYYKIPIVGKRICVVGRSNLVGKPTAIVFVNKGATVTVCHSQTTNLPEETKRADILIVATGHPSLISKDYVSSGQVVIDVGLSRVKGKLVGDVVSDEVERMVFAITPVPGGVGPMTVASLFENLLISVSEEV